MPEPLAICIEDLAPHSPGDRYLRCVAVSGRQPGLRVDRAGRVLWKSDADAACELWVSGDDKLILFRPEGAARVVVRRDGRSLDVPVGKPVVLLDQDQVVVGSRRLRVHIHGPAAAIRPPALLPVTGGSSLGRSAAAAVALGAALAAADCQKARAPNDVEVREQPPAPPSLVPHVAPDADADDPSSMPDAMATDVAAPIEVRVAPPQVPAPMAPDEVVEPWDANRDAAEPTAGESADASTADAGAAAPAEDGGPPDAARRREAGHRPPPIEVREAPPFDDK